MDALCSHCSELNLESALCSPADGGTAHQPSLASLRQSAQEGCPLCSGILTSFEDHTPRPEEIDESAPIFYNVWNWTEDDRVHSQGSGVIIFYSRPGGPGRSWSRNLGIYVDEGSILPRRLALKS
ncbi:hypothetical protein K431DRAFT_288808 [Polychaeton citri CBS 116435]|uniref:Uncharacterized protein n=1 Tax=Polychaeton citri CBS 116435 TaxID=1314669 RepID=A0A9P4ULA9_9PEZI|nr:hypothetical protein K431DRAFT_288808 [Polychaeton citri CBS 116435]